MYLLFGHQFELRYLTTDYEYWRLIEATERSYNIQVDQILREIVYEILLDETDRAAI